jgi:glutamyl/glutaminyl-tRNA synthetase
MLFNAVYKKTRIAPTPSGFLHLGNILSFAITSTMAQKNGAKVLLRIDDIDRVRANKKYIQDIFDTLNFLGVPWDEGPLGMKEFDESYSQMHRIDMYREALKQLVDKELVFACTCSRSQLKNNGLCKCINRQIPLTDKNACWRLITENDRAQSVKTYKGGPARATLPGNMRNFIVKKKDGFPAYQLTSVIDDLFFGVDLVVRGDDLWPSTLAQLELAGALGKNDFSGITFHHHLLLKEASGTKLSKSAGTASVKYLRESGKQPADIYRLIASMLGIKETIKSWEQMGDAVINFEKPGFNDQL